MPSKKKSKPSFDVPEDLQTAPQAGWVYRSDKEAASAAKKPEEKPAASSVAAKGVSGGDGTAHAKKTPAHVAPAPAAASKVSERPPETKAKKSEEKSKSSSKSDDGILDLASKTLHSGFETIGNAVRLTTRILAAPITMGMRLIGIKSK